MEHDANVAAKKKAKQLAHKASKRFEDVVWPALLQLEVSTRAQQHVAMALTSEFEARQAALGDPPSPPSGARLGSAPYLHGASVPHGVDTGPVRVDGSSSVAKSTGAGAGADGGARALPYGSSGSVASGTTYSAVESYHDERTVGGQTANGGAPDAHEAAELKVRARVTLYCVKGGHARVFARRTVTPPFACWLARHAYVWRSADPRVQHVHEACARRSSRPASGGAVFEGSPAGACSS